MFNFTPFLSDFCGQLTNNFIFVKVFKAEMYTYINFLGISVESHDTEKLNKANIRI